MRTTLGTRGFAWGFIGAASAIFLFGTILQNWLVTLLGPFVVAAGFVIAAYVSSAQHAERDFFEGFARRHRFTYLDRLALLETTPLLGAGQSRSCTHYMEGLLTQALPGTSCGLAWFTYETSDENSDRRGRTIETRAPHHFTVCVVDIESAMRAFPGIFLIRRRSLFRVLDGDQWLDVERLREVELESSSFQERYELFVSKSQEQNQLLRLFRPSFLVWMSEHPLEAYFEFAAGTLVVYLHQRESDSTQLDYLLEVTAFIAQSLVEQAAGQKSASVPPVQ